MPECIMPLVLWLVLPTRKLPIMHAMVSLILITFVYNKCSMYQHKETLSSPRRYSSG
jgi:hypothetical protein